MAIFSHNPTTPQEYLDHLTEKVKIVSSLIQNIYSYQIYIFIPKTLSSWVSSSRDSFIRNTNMAGQGRVKYYTNS